MTFENAVLAFKGADVAFGSVDVAFSILFSEARKSKHAPTSQRERDAMLIYNFDPIFSGKDGYVMWPYRYTTTMKQMNNVII